MNVARDRGDPAIEQLLRFIGDIVRVWLTGRGPKIYKLGLFRLALGDIDDQILWPNVTVQNAGLMSFVESVRRLTDHSCGPYTVEMAVDVQDLCRGKGVNILANQKVWPVCELS